MNQINNKRKLNINVYKKSGFKPTYKQLYDISATYVSYKPENIKFDKIQYYSDYKSSVNITNKYSNIE